MSRSLVLEAAAAVGLSTSLKADEVPGTDYARAEGLNDALNGRDWDLLARGAEDAAQIATGRVGGVPLQKLSATARRQLTSHGQGHRTNAPARKQGQREMERRRKQLLRAGQPVT